jgi:hypothetical protein
MHDTNWFQKIYKTNYRRRYDPRVLNGMEYRAVCL